MHGAEDHHQEEISGFRAAERKRLVRTMELGLLCPTHVQGLMRTLDDGFADGETRKRCAPLVPDPHRDALPNYVSTPAPSQIILKSCLWNRKKTRLSAAKSADDALVTLLDFRRSSRALTVLSLIHI